MPQTVRRIITGEDAQGKAIVVTDGQPPIAVTIDSMAGFTMTELWDLVTLPTSVRGGGEPPPGPVALEPVAGGVRWRIVEIPPDDKVAANLDMGALVQELGAKTTGLLEKSDPERLGMHRTDTIDFVVVLSGEVWLELDGSETHLRAGDCIVQRGTWHAWRNRASEPCIMSAVLIGAPRE